MSDKTSTPDEQPDRDDTGDGRDPGSGSAVVTGEQSAAAPDIEGAVPVVEDETVVDVPVAAPDAPTAHMPVPAEGGGGESHGTAHAGANGSGNGNVPAAAVPPAAAAVGAPPRRPGGPDPAPGPVPGPGPEAATPPPWRRIPGQAGPERHDPPREPAPAGGLIDEGPTAFLRAPEPEPARSEDAGRAPVRASRSRAPRQAALQLRRLDPWSVLKLALVLAVVLFFVWLVAVGVLYGVLNGIGVWDRLNGTYADLVSGQAQSGAPLISAGRVFGFAAVVGAINSLLFAVAVTIAAFVYNVSADLVGGVEVTLSERD
ncbi:DUF3566 domain-containing protein [Pseudonocardia hydrocarbonoxydans]|uniref:DUF3566 domain-containing protein n=1 Tax=Pseudonocardia hydrocarbonoxydans TaxID=76726 RepID=A0A4Y3WYA9_9PSEU|nr:hypothetical protein PHY01_49920 [Pseudonocardia hydrocarbonoxydans]